jgi:hypothetical protein
MNKNRFRSNPAFGETDEPQGRSQAGGGIWESREKCWVSLDLRDPSEGAGGFFQGKTCMFTILRQWRKVSWARSCSSLYAPAEWSLSRSNREPLTHFKQRHGTCQGPEVY